MIIQADARHIPLRDETVQCCITSPPYFGLRDYKLGDRGIGLERTLDEWIANLVAVFREVRRVLKPDGTVWLNVGDAYARDPAKGDRANYLGLHKNIIDSGCHTAMQHRSLSGLKPKDLMLLPTRVALALQSDGWWLRSAITLCKLNPMPESVTDRPTNATEMLFLLTKQADYFYDNEAVKEKATYAGGQLGICRGTKRRASAMGRTPSGNGIIGSDAPINEGRNLRNWWTLTTEPNTWATCHACGFTTERWPKCAWCGGVNDLSDTFRNGKGYRNNHAVSSSVMPILDSQNKCPRCHGKQICPMCKSTEIVAHYAAFPTKIPELCIKAGSRPGDLVLDPFGGSATTAVVAERLGRRWVSLDLSLDYCRIGKARTSQRSLFTGASSTA